MRTNSRRFAIAILLSLAPTLAPQRSFAQAAGADPTVQAAHARFAEGVEFFDKGDFENARAAFLQAYALHKHPAVLINLALSSLRSGHTLDADRYFTRYIKESTNLTPAQREQADNGLTEARTKLGRIDVLAPAGVAVTIDTEIAGTDGPTTLDVEPGTHTVKGGGETSSVTVAAGQTVMVKLGKGGGGAAVVPVEVAPVPEQPAATPATPEQPAAGTPPAASNTESKPGLFSPPATLVPVWVGAGVGFAGFVTAIVLVVFKGNAQDAYNNQVTLITSAIKGNSAGACVNPKTASLANGCSVLNQDSSAVSSDATVGNVGLVAGIVGVTFAAGWYLFAPKRDQKPASTALQPSVVPLVGPHVGGLALGASF